MALCLLWLWLLFCGCGSVVVVVVVLWLPVRARMTATMYNDRKIFFRNFATKVYICFLQQPKTVTYISLTVDKVMTNLEATLSTISNVQAIIAVSADAICRAKSLRCQPALAKAIVTVVHELKTKQTAAEFVAEHPQHVLQNQLPGLIVGRCEGALSENEQEQKCKRMKTVYNLLAGNEVLSKISDENADDFLTYGFLTNPDAIDKALYTAYSKADSRRLFLDACRYQCLLLDCCETSDDPKYFKLAKQFERLMTKCSYAPVDPNHKGTRDGKRTRQQYEDLTQEDADAHIADLQYSAKTLKKFINPLLQTMLTEAKKGNPQKLYTKHLSRMHAFQGVKKRLGTWVQSYIMLATKHGTADSDELRSLRTGDWQRMKLGSLTTELGENSIIVQSDKELTLHVVSTKIKFRCTIPLHERCPELSQFFTDVWIPIMKEYQNTDQPYILCTILNNPEKRKQLSVDAVEKLNTRALKAAGIEATTNFSRHCDAKRSRTGPNRPEESAHGARQDVQYQNCSAVEPDCDAGIVQTDDKSDDEIDFDQFRCPATGVADLRDVINRARGQ
jgi:hypothetical protein